MMTDQDRALFQPLSAKVARKKFSVGGRELKDHMVRSAESQRTAKFLLSKMSPPAKRAK